MIYDLQRASMLKRVSAWLLDAILLCIVATLMAWLLSIILSYDSYVQQLDTRYSYFENEYGINRYITTEQYDALSPEERAVREAADLAIQNDAEAIYAYNMIINLSMLMISFSILLSYLTLDFAVPLLFGHGQTVGKKIFGIAVMRQEGIRVNGVCMFIRTVLGKFAIEAMIPAMLILLLFIGAIREFGWLIMGIIVIAEAVLLLTTRERCMIHDKLASTVTVDFASQMIFETQEDLIAYKQKVAAEKAAQKSY